MTNPVLSALGTFLLYAVAALVAQNAVFTRGLGVSRLVSLMADTGLARTRLCVVLSLVQVCCVPLAWWAHGALLAWGYWNRMQPLVYVGCAVAVCLALWLVFALLRRVFSGAHSLYSDLIALLPVAGFNTSVIGTLLVTTTQNYTLLQSFGFALGSGLGYWLAVTLVWEAQRKLSSRSIPAAFRGLPVTLLYIGILALAIYGFTGHTVII